MTPTPPTCPNDEDSREETHPVPWDSVASANRTLTSARALAEASQALVARLARRNLPLPAPPEETARREALRLSQRQLMRIRQRILFRLKNLADSLRRRGTTLSLLLSEVHYVRGELTGYRTALADFCAQACGTLPGCLTEHSRLDDIRQRLVVVDDWAEGRVPMAQAVQEMDQAFLDFTAHLTGLAGCMALLVDPHPSRLAPTEGDSR